MKKYFNVFEAMKQSEKEDEQFMMVVENEVESFGVFRKGSVIGTKSRFGGLLLVEAVSKDGLFTQPLKQIRDKTGSLVLVEDTNSKSKFVGLEEIKTRNLVLRNSMRLKKGTLGSTWK